MAQMHNVHGEMQLLLCWFCCLCCIFQVDRGGPLAGIPRSGPVADVLTPNFIATLLQDSSLLRDVRLVSNPNAMGLAPALEIGGLLGHLVRVKVRWPRVGG